MLLTPAQLQTLRAMLQHGGQAHRGTRKSPAEWTWNVGGTPRSGTVDRLYRAGLLKAVHRDTLEISATARRALGQAADSHLPPNARSLCCLRSARRQPK